MLFTVFASTSAARNTLV